VRWSAQAIAGIGRRHGAFVTVLDLDSLFASPELSALGGKPAVEAAA